MSKSRSFPSYHYFIHDLIPTPLKDTKKDKSYLIVPTLFSSSSLKNSSKPLIYLPFFNTPLITFVYKIESTSERRNSKWYFAICLTPWLP